MLERINHTFVWYVLYMFSDVDDPVEKINEHLPAQIRVLGNYSLVI